MMNDAWLELVAVFACVTGRVILLFKASTGSGIHSMKLLRNTGGCNYSQETCWALNSIACGCVQQKWQCTVVRHCHMAGANNSQSCAPHNSTRRPCPRVRGSDSAGLSTYVHVMSRLIPGPDKAMLAANWSWRHEYSCGVTMSLIHEPE